MSDTCEHGVSYETECEACEAQAAEAHAAGAITPHEIGLYWKGALAERRKIDAILAPLLREAAQAIRGES